MIALQSSNAGSRSRGPHETVIVRTTTGQAARKKHKTTKEHRTLKLAAGTFTTKAEGPKKFIHAQSRRRQRRREARFRASDAPAFTGRPVGSVSGEDLRERGSNAPAERKCWSGLGRHCRVRSDATLRREAAI